jgi:hypothetical protein
VYALKSAWQRIKRTISGATSAAVGVGSVTTIRHRNLVLLIDMTAPHTLCIDPGIGTTTECAPQTRLLTLRPGFTSTFLKVLFLSRAPTSGRFELGRVWNCIRVGVHRRNEVLWIQEPIFVFRHDGVCEALRILLSVREMCERRVKEDHIWVGGCGVHGVHNMS